MKIFSFKSKKSIIAFLFFGTLIFITAFSAIRIASMQKDVSDTANSNEKENDSSAFELNDAVITRLLLDGIPDNLPLSDVIVHISDDSTIRTDCTVSTHGIIDYCITKGVKIPASVRLMANILPETVDASLSLRIAVDSASQQLSFTPQSVSVNGIDLTSELLPEDFSVSINNAVNSIFSEKNKKIESITVSDGKILINLADK